MWNLAVHADLLPHGSPSLERRQLEDLDEKTAGLPEVRHVSRGPVEVQPSALALAVVRVFLELLERGNRRLRGSPGRWFGAAATGNR